MAGWSENTRGLVSVLLLAHVVALIAMLLTNNQYNDPAQINLADRLKRPAVHLFPLWFDRPMDRHLTSGDELDADHFLELTGNDRRGQTHVLRLPDPQASRFGEREKWQQAARLAALSQAGVDADGNDRRILELAAAWRLHLAATEINVNRVTITARRRQRAILDEPPIGDPLDPLTLSGPIYQAVVKWTDENQSPIFTKLGGPARDKAPVLQPAPALPTAPTNSAPVAAPQSEVRP